LLNGAAIEPCARAALLPKANAATANEPMTPVRNSQVFLIFLSSPEKSCR